MGERRDQVSRRGLFGALGKTLRTLASSLEEGGRDVRAAHTGRAPDALPPRPANLPRIPRDDAQCAAARSDGFQAWRTDRMLETIRPGASICLRGEDLPEPIVVVRVNPVHVTAASGECPADGSELDWSSALDRLFCPSCRSKWRLDGEPMDGPANASLAVFFVTSEPDGLRITTP